MTSKLASLHAGLVARKGEATPALTNPMFSYVDAPRPAQSIAATPVRASEPVIERPEWPTVARRPMPEQPAPEPVTPQRVVTEQASPVAMHDEVKPLDHQVQARDAVPARKIEVAHVPARPKIKPAPEKAEHDDHDDDHAHRHRMTFRLTPSQRRRLRLAAAVQDKSLQELLSTALDNHLEGLCACSMKSCACLAAAAAQES